MLVELLREKRALGKPLELPEIMAAGIAQHGARMTETRRRGFVVRNEMERSPDGRVLSRYWLEYESRAGWAAMTAKPQRQRGPVLLPPSGPAIQWRDYDRIAPGVYPAYCRWAKHYRDPGFKRWTCLLLFDVLSGDLVRVVARVPFWMNLGAGDKPHAGRRKKYFKEWVRANGEPPARQDRLSPKVFTARTARVEIGDTKGDAPYSVVRKIISWETGVVRGHSVSSHTVKDGKG